MAKFKKGDKVLMFQEVNDKNKTPKNPSDYGYTSSKWIVEKTVLTITKVTMNEKNDVYDYEVVDGAKNTYSVFETEIKSIYKSWKERLGGTE